MKNRKAYKPTGHRQVFGLAGWNPTSLGFPSRARDSGRTQCHWRGGRSRLPLLGSPGFAPGSLFNAPL